MILVRGPGRQTRETPLGQVQRPQPAARRFLVAMQECLAAIGRQFKIQVHALIEIGVDLGTVALGDGHIIPGFLVCAIFSAGPSSTRR